LSLLCGKGESDRRVLPQMLDSYPGSGVLAFWLPL